MPGNAQGDGNSLTLVKNWSAGPEQIMLAAILVKLSQSQPATGCIRSSNDARWLFMNSDSLERKRLRLT